MFFLTSRVTSLWEFYLLYFIQGFAAACGVIPVNTALANWFDKKRGTAIGIAMAGMSLGAITITPAGGLVLENFWQSTYGSQLDTRPAALMSRACTRMGWIPQAWLMQANQTEKQARVTGHLVRRDGQFHI